MGGFRGHEEPDFAFGSMFGIRSFNVDTYRGTLHAMTAHYEYHSGENRAKCNKYMTDAEGNSLTYFSGFGYQDTGDRSLFQWVNGRVFHRLASNNCSCGFYAYYDRVYNDYSTQDTITGIVSAYGRVSYSNRGFRAEKVKIVAAVNPFLQRGEGEEGPVLPRGLARDLMLKNWTDGRRLMFLRVVWLLFTIPFSLAAFFIKDHLWMHVVSVVMGGMLGLTIGAGKRIRFRYEKAERARARMQIEYNTETARLVSFEQRGNHYVSFDVGATAFKKVARKYPEIKWYRTLSEMLAAHQLSKYRDTPAYRSGKDKRIKEYEDPW